MVSSDVQTGREVFRRLRALIRDHAGFAPRYEQAKAVVRAFRKPAFYEVSQRCNLFCEGCYYFEDAHPKRVREQNDTATWDAFFAAEAERHVTMAYFVGAEPALHQDRLIAAARHFPYGNIGTNGTIRIDPAVPYRIGVSVWAADDVTDRRLRGASVFRKALANYQGDPRAIILFTLSPWNLKGARTLAQMCRDHGLPLTFNMYSPTATFLDRLQRGDDNDRQYFRVSRPDSTPCFTDQDLAVARRTVRELMDDFPETVVYSDAYNDWVTQPGSLYEIDEATGVATHCGSRIVGNMRYHTADLGQRSVKCCTPDIDCRRCRMYSGGWSSKFQPTLSNVASAGAFSGWLDMINTLGEIFLYDRARSARHAPALEVAV